MSRKILRAAVPGALVALVLGLQSAASAAGAPHVVDCTTGPVIINDSSTGYDLIGPCGEVVINGSHVSVGMESAQHVVVTGTYDSVFSNLSLVSVDLYGSTNTVRASHVGIMRMTGTQLTALVGNGERVKVHGSHNLVRYEQLGRLVIKGSHNKAHTRRGKTTVRVTGAHNKVDVHKRR